MQKSYNSDGIRGHCPVNQEGLEPSTNGDEEIPERRDAIKRLAALKQGSWIWQVPSWRFRPGEEDGAVEVVFSRNTK